MTERYQKQILFSGIGEEGQAALTKSRVLICGCGALGSVLAETLTRSGVGFIRIVDRDFVELSNLQRQVLFDENDVANRTPKAIAAENRLREINSEIEIEGVVADVSFNNIAELASGVDLILDGTDNFEVRFLINDFSLESGIPWIYTGCVGSHGQTMSIFPNETACLRCLIDNVPEPGSMETCDTAGVLATAINVIASLEATDALKILSGNKAAVKPVLKVVDVWDGSMRNMNAGTLRETANCPACVNGERLWLEGRTGSQSSVLCGRNAVQISPAEPTKLSLPEMAQRLGNSGSVTQNAFLLRLQLNDPAYDITLFADGRAIIKGTEDIAVARSVYSRYIGS
ncbi:MAG: ThiF family adenylyltransferase [Planctomycetaceae bacterium]